MTDTIGDTCTVRTRLAPHRHEPAEISFAVSPLIAPLTLRVCKHCGCLYAEAPKDD